MSNHQNLEEYYIQRKGSFVGNSPLWWSKGGNGYTAYIQGAERFSPEDADRLINENHNYVKFKCSEVDSRLHLVYDIQDNKKLGTDNPCSWPFGYAKAIKGDEKHVGTIYFDPNRRAPQIDWERNTPIENGAKIFTYPADSIQKIKSLEEENAQLKSKIEYLEMQLKCM